MARHQDSGCIPRSPARFAKSASRKYRVNPSDIRRAWNSRSLTGLNDRKVRRCWGTPSVRWSCLRLASRYVRDRGHVAVRRLVQLKLGVVEFPLETLGL